jgi:2-keto-3-deoxy-L-fuconate dehydrogenase
MKLEESFRLEGAHAVITGGASGIGNAIARIFHGAGAKICLLDLNADAAEAAAAAIGRDVLAVACDVSDEQSVAQAFSTVARQGPATLLVNSAGVAHVGTVLDTSASDFDRLYRVNVRGTYLCMAAGARQMQQAGSGVILNMASIAATSGLPDRFAYSMTKGAVLAMTLSAARDLLPSHIRVNCISPARVHTPFVDGFLARTYPGREEEMFGVLSRSQPIGRMGSPEEIALLALYLCSPAAAFITGTDYPIDGGFFNLR